MVFSLKDRIKKPTQKTELNFLGIEILLDTDATICILITQTRNAIKAYLSPSKDELKEDVDTNLRTAKSQLLPTEGIVKCSPLPLRDHHALLAITFAIADTKNNILELPFLQTFCKTIKTERSCLIPKKILHNTTPLKQKRFLKVSLRQQRNYSKIFTLTVENVIIFPDVKYE